MANYINQNLNLLNDSYHIIMMQYYNQSCRPFWLDLRQTTFDSFRLNNYFFAEILSIVMVTCIVWNLRHSWFERFIDNLIANKILIPEDRNKFDENFWTFIHRIILFLFAWKIVSETDDFINIGNYNKTIPTQIKLFFLFDICEYIRSAIELIVGCKKYKDDWIFFMHHMVVIICLTLTYMVRQHLLAVLSIYILEWSTIFVFMRSILKLKFSRLQCSMASYNNICRTIWFFVTLTVWIPNRLYTYPFFMIPLAGDTAQKHCQLETLSTIIIAYSLLYIIYLINFYWTFLLFKSVYIIHQRGIENFEDYRDTDVLVENKKNCK